jgi:hypothetical protein
MLVLGIIGEYLGRLFMTSNARPQYIVRETYRPAVESAGQVTPTASNSPAPITSP